MTWILLTQKDIFSFMLMIFGKLDKHKIEYYRKLRQYHFDPCVTYTKTYITPQHLLTRRSKMTAYISDTHKPVTLQTCLPARRLVTPIKSGRYSLARRIGRMKFLV